MRVLIVEDDETIASFVAKGLEEAGFAVDQRPRRRAGLEMALATPYDAAIVDVMLPGHGRPGPRGDAAAPRGCELPCSS